MDIQDVRRANLLKWTESHSVPPKEKSYFSQLLGGASFGERAARRLERDYGMGEGVLDRTLDDESVDSDGKLGPGASLLLKVVEGRDDTEIMRIAQALQVLLGASALSSEAVDDHAEVVIAPPPRRRRKHAANE
ncbi:hypothetical protein [Paraburkholderia sp. UCT2]|uniref:hypothetical protein n=1 Tax=Paraburkholderia sp. UCT2 TaxID=2615208 RepID=UPI0016562EE4|nr:hypothetical protein [Paraburkholderia sp. UCT2]MBC8730017.1 hypothetical protein [Paraburkholderia sp. UCT2]